MNANIKNVDLIHIKPTPTHMLSNYIYSIIMKKAITLLLSLYRQCADTFLPNKNRKKIKFFPDILRAVGKCL